MISIEWTDVSFNSGSELMQAFIMGLRFDIIVVGYILSLPLFVLGVASFFNNKINLLIKGLFIYLIGAYIVLLLILCADIPYFLQFYSRLTTSSLLWMDDSKYMFSMIFHTKSFFIYFLLFLILSVLIIKYLLKARKRFVMDLSLQNFKRNKNTFFIKMIVFLVIASCFFVGIRGRTSAKSPMRIGAAYFCNNQTLNKLSLNPVFTFFYSLKYDLSGDKKIGNLKNDKANLLSSLFLKIPDDDLKTKELILKWNNNYGNQPIKNNIVFIIMESMGSFKLGKYNGPKNLTPNLNNIISKSIFFDNIYTSGIHTFNGIYSTLFSYPAIYKRQPLEELMNVPQQGIAQILKISNYSTFFFTTHDPQFDNVSGFLKANGYDQIVSEFDYPAEWERSTNGVPDHQMFEFAVPVLSNLSNNGKPFFATFMTSSDHKPYVIPDNINFKPLSDKLELQIVEYADWSIGNFFEQASKTKWFNNTTFVLIADHGLSLGHTYDMPLSYHRTPLIIYTPSSSEICDTLYNLGGQIDVVPTVLGLLNIPYKNKTMGINLFKNKRPFMYFSADDKIGCLDKEYYLIIRPENNESLYRYENLETDNYIDSFKSKSDSMKLYMFSMMQTTEEGMSQIPLLK